MSEAGPGVAREQRYEGCLLAFAYGDALGWPNESRARNSKRGYQALSLEPWTRKYGGKFQPMEEEIPAGTYSDDTQLTIAVARSRLLASNWWKHLADIEFPFWTLYQQGGGSATLRATKALAKGQLPWETEDHDRYYNAGGNGVAMRVSAHCIVNARESSFEVAAQDIISDGVLTHGSPVALVGALAYAFALWLALRLTGTLQYGSLLDEVVERVDEWARLPDISDRWPSWLENVDRKRYLDNWENTVNEQLRLLWRAADGLKVGALAFDDEVLRDLGCFDVKVNGAGTVAAAASIYLASKYAASPAEAVAQAAIAKGADTDTIAAMTGAIVGAVNGSEWLTGRTENLQDRVLLIRLASELPTPRQSDLTTLAIPPATNKRLRSLMRDLDSARGTVALPTGLFAKVERSNNVRSRSNNLAAESWRIVDEWEQSIIITKVKRIEKEAPEGGETIAAPTGKSRVAGVGFNTFDLNVSKYFYSKLLGVEIIRDTPELIQVGEFMVLREGAVSRTIGVGTTIYVDVDHIHERWHALKSERPNDVGNIEEGRGRPRFLCRDPDGRVVEVFQRMRS